MSPCLINIKEGNNCPSALQLLLRLYPAHDECRKSSHCCNSSTTVARCLKITEKVSFNIASEASYVYILNGEKLILIFCHY